MGIKTLTLEKLKDSTIPFRSRCLLAFKVLTVRLGQIYAILFNPFLYSFYVAKYLVCRKSFSIDDNLILKDKRIDLLVILNPRRASSESCPTTQRLIRLKSHDNLRILYVFDHLYTLRFNIFDKAAAYPWLALFAFLTTFDGVQSVRKYWLLVFQRFKPRAVVCLMPSEGLVDAALLACIQIYDLQHGIIYPDHYWYKKVCKKLESSISSSQPSLLSFLVWSNYEKSILKNLMPRYCQLPNRVVVVGPPLSMLGMDNTRKEQLSMSQRVNILFTCSYDHRLTYNSVEIDKLDPFLLATNDFLCFLTESKNLFTRFRLHPAARTFKIARRQLQGINKLQQTILSIDSIDRISISHESLEEDLRWCDVHVTLNSSVCLEASSLGIASLVLCPAQNRIYYDPFKNLQNISILFRNDFNSVKSAVVSLLNLQSSLRNNPTTPSNVKASFQNASLQSFLRSTLNV